MRNRGRKAARCLTVAVITAVVATTVAAIPAAANGRTQLQRDVDALRELGVTGVLARAETTKGVEVARSGVADLRSGAAIPRDAHLRMGSTTKTFVATVVLQLAGEGRLDLSDSVERWLPGVVAGKGNNGHAVTIRDLLQHTSGIHNYIFDLVPNYVTPESYRRERWRTYSPARLVGIAMGHPPGDGTWAYSNTNYVLAGMLIEAVTGRGWEDEVHDRIIHPLGLHHTTTPGTWPFLRAPHARNYHQFEPGGHLVDTTIAIRGLDSGADGSMISTARDINAFFGALVSGRLLPPSQLREMQKLIAIPDGNGYPPGSGAGLGLFHRALPCGGGYWGHGGNGFGYTLEPAINDDGNRRLTVSMFTGTFDPEAAAARGAALDRLVINAMCG